MTGSLDLGALLVDDGGRVGPGLYGVHDHAGERAVLGRVAHRPESMVEPKRIEETAFAHDVHGQGEIAGSANGSGSDNVIGDNLPRRTAGNGGYLLELLCTANPSNRRGAFPPIVSDSRQTGFLL